MKDAPGIIETLLFFLVSVGTERVSRQTQSGHAQADWYPEGCASSFAMPDDGSALLVDVDLQCSIYFEFLEFSHHGM